MRSSASQKLSHRSPSSSSPPSASAKASRVMRSATLAELMHDPRQIIYYGDDEGLRDFVVLNPEWLTKAISYVLEDEPTRKAAGSSTMRA